VAFFWLLFFAHAKKSDLPKAMGARQGRRNPSLKATRNPPEATHAGSEKNKIQMKKTPPGGQKKLPNST
jgi:hypothetical protein